MIDWLKKIPLILLLLLISNLILYGFLAFRHAIESIILHITVSLLVIAFAYFRTLFSLHNEVSLLMNHYRSLPSAIRKPALSFLLPRFKEHLEQSHLIISQGIRVDNEEIEKLVEASFAVCSGSYQGTDSNPPSVFNRLYPTYVKMQTDRRERESQRDSRILLVSEGDLENDFQREPKVSGSFVTNHSTNGIILLQVEPNVAAYEAGRLHLQSTDIGVFGWKFVVFYIPPSSGRPKYVASILPLTGGITKEIATYLIALNVVAKRVDIREGGLRLDHRSNSEIDSQRKRMFDGNDWPRAIK